MCKNNEFGGISNIASRQASPYGSSVGSRQSTIGSQQSALIYETEMGWCGPGNQLTCLEVGGLNYYLPSLYNIFNEHKIPMKKLTLLFTFCLFALFAFAQTYTFTSTNFSGWPPMNWTAPATWTITGGIPGYEYPQTTNDIVIINGVVVLNEDNLEVASVTIDYNTLNSVYGSLDIGNNTFTTEGNFVVNSNTTSGGIALSGGAINIGNGTEDGFIINGGSFAWSDGAIDISGYFALNGGTLTLSSNLTMNVCTAGVRSEGNYNYYVSESANITLNAVTLTVNIKNGNNNAGNIAEVYQENATFSGITGSTLNLNLSNVDGDTGPFYYVSDIPMNNFASDIGSGNTLYYKSVTQYDSVFFEEVILTSGSAYIESDETVYCYLSFNNGQTNDVTVDGLLIVPGTLTSSSNIVGNGTVYANTYSLGSNTVYGIPQDDLTAASYFSASTWLGTQSNDWNNKDNWQTITVPTDATDVTIWSGAGNMPVIGTPPGAQSKNLIINAGTSLKINSGSDFTSTTGLQMINNSGTLTIDGGTLSFSGIKMINNASSTILIDNGGVMTVTMDDNYKTMENLDAINLDNNSSLIITGDLDMRTGSTLNVQGGSTVEIKQ